MNIEEFKLNNHTNELIHNKNPDNYLNKTYIDIAKIEYLVGHINNA
jgi:hypothetical protein